MTKIKIRASAEEAAKAGQDQGEFEVPKPGYYHLKLIEANAGFSKDSDGNEDQDKPRIECVYEIVGEGMEAAEVEKNYGRIWDYVTFGDGYAATRRVEWVLAFDANANVADIVAGKYEIDTDDLVERTVVARLKHEKDKQKTEEAKAADRKASPVFRARIAMLINPANVDEHAVAEYSGDAYGSANGGEETTDVFGDTAPADENGEYALLTQEELEAMDPKELGATAKEFDLVTDDLLVKVRGKVNVEKTKAAIIAAILEAQGADDSGGDAADEGNPF
jgi:hypothetical protein